MGSISHGRGVDIGARRPRDRLARYLAARCASPKALAREISDGEINVTPKAAENLLNGHWPNDLTMAAIVRRFGAGVWTAVFLPDVAPELARLREEEAALNERVGEIRRRRREVEGLEGSRADRRRQVAAEA